MSYDFLIEEIGAFGWYQAMILVFLAVPEMFSAFALLLPVFAGTNPGMTCLNVSDSYTETHSNVTLVKDMKDVDICKECDVIKYDDSFTSIVTEWNLICSQDYVSDLITTIQMSGLLFGAGIFGQLSQSFGRRKAALLACGLLIVAGLISAVAPNWKIYTAARFLVGISTGGYSCVGAVYQMEFVGAKWRTLCGTIGWWALGLMLLGPIAYFIREWRILILATSLSGFLSVFLIWFLPESPRWLAQHDRVDEAKAVLSRIAKFNQKPKPDMSYLDRVMEEHKGEETKDAKKYTYLDLFSTRKLVFRIIFVFATWFTLFLTYYELSFNIRNLSGNRYLNMFYSGLTDQIAAFGVLLLNNKMGRRHLLATVIFLTLAANTCMLSLYLTGRRESLPNVYKLCALLGKGAVVTGTDVIIIFTAELYPTCIRNLGVGAGLLAARFGAIFAPQILYLGDKYPLAPFLVIMTLCVLVLPLIYVPPETNGKPLTDHLHECNGTSADSKETSPLEETGLTELNKSLEIKI